MWFLIGIIWNFARFFPRPVRLFAFSTSFFHSVTYSTKASRSALRAMFWAKYLCSFSQLCVLARYPCSERIVVWACIFSWVIVVRTSKFPSLLLLCRCRVCSATLEVSIDNGLSLRCGVVDRDLTLVFSFDFIQSALLNASLYICQ